MEPALRARIPATEAVTQGSPIEITLGWVVTHKVAEPTILKVPVTPAVVHASPGTGAGVIEDAAELDEASEGSEIGDERPVELEDDESGADEELLALTPDEVPTVEPEPVSGV